MQKYKNANPVVVRSNCMDYHMVRVNIFLEVSYFCNFFSLSKFHSAKDRKLQHLMAAEAAPHKNSSVEKKGFNSLVGPVGGISSVIIKY